MKWTGKDHGTHVVMSFGPSPIEKAFLLMRFVFWDVPFILLWEVPRELWRRRKT
jgi:hypothetical protein